MKVEKQLIKGIKLLREGKEEGFNILYSHTYNFVFGRARVIMKNHENAVELTQDTYIQAYKGISGLKDDKNIYGWLSSIVYNRGMKMFGATKDVLVEEDGEYIFEEVISTDVDTNPQESLDEKETAVIIKDMIDSLPDVQRVAVLAIYYDNMKIDEIAASMECSSNTIKSRLNYAKKSLKEMVVAHEKQNAYRLHSLTPLAISLGVGALIAQKECVLAYASAGSVYASACGAVGVTASQLGVTAMAGAAGGAVLTFGAKIGIGAAVLAATGGIVAGGVAISKNVNNGNNTSVLENQTTSGNISEEVESTTAFEEVMVDENNVITDYVSLQYNGKRTNILIGSHGVIVYNGGQGTFVSKNTGYSYSEVVTLTGTEIVAGMEKENGTVALLLTDGTLWNGGKDANWYGVFNDEWIVLERVNGDVSTYDVYNSKMELCYTNLDGFERPSDVDDFGKYFVAYADETTYVYDEDMNQVGCVEYSDGFSVILNGKYLWDGMNLRDSNYNVVNLNVSGLFSNAKTTITKVENSDLNSKLAEVTVDVSKSDGTDYLRTVYLDSNLKAYADYLDTPVGRFTWIDSGEVQVVKDNEDRRFLVWTETGEIICEDYEWDKVCGHSIYFMGAGIYGENRILVEVAWLEGTDYVTGFGVLPRKYNYSIEMGEMILVTRDSDALFPKYENWLWYNGNNVLHNDEFYEHDNVFFNTDSAYYGDWVGNEYVVYTAWGEEYFRSNVEICASVSEMIFLSVKEVDGQKVYELYTLETKPNVTKPALDEICEVPKDEPTPEPPTEEVPEVKPEPKEIEWRMEGTTLYITGDVAMDDYEYNSETLFAPWVIEYKDTIEHVVIGDGVKSIGEAAFQNCKNLKTVVIPNSVTVIKKAAFHNCESLEAVDLPDNLEDLGWGAFYNTGITSITIPGTIVNFSESWVADCKNLTEITLEDGMPCVIQTLATYSSNLKTVNLPNTVTIIGWAAFYGCTSLETFVVNEGATRIMDFAFYDCTSLTKLYIPASVTTIDEDILGSAKDTVTIYCKSGSVAETYAIEKGINYEIY